MTMCIKGKITAAIKRANFLYFPLKYIVLIFNKSNPKKKKKIESTSRKGTMNIQLMWSPNPP